jgi:hypothetical protein
MFLSLARPIQSTSPHPTSPRSILIYPPTYVLVFLLVSFPLAFPPIIYTHSSSPPFRATWPAYFILLDLIILIMLGKEYKLRSSSLCNFLYSPVTSSLFGPNILLSTLFSYILSVCSSFNVRDQVSHQYRITGKIMVLRILIF